MKRTSLIKAIYDLSLIQITKISQKSKRRIEHFCLHKELNIGAIKSNKPLQGSHCLGVAKPMSVPRKEPHSPWLTCLAGPAIS
ncbi:unnamed protein product [Trifolium pratense]|uniref:Uncharacterized protein n=1 Tax=Trifolium pratense TaxID=57577 RepID=A0ACB0KGU1_TRIPR|nr:unnamed protein product [Trifolium pratense]